MAEHMGGGDKPTVPLYSLARRYAAKCRVLLPDVTAPALGHQLWLWLSHQLWLQLWLWLQLRHVTAEHVRGGDIPAYFPFAAFRACNQFFLNLPHSVPATQFG